MKNYVQRGDTLTLTAPETVVSGALLIVGSFVGVAAHDADNGDDVETSLTGVFTLPKAAGALSQGAKLYWDSANKNVVSVASGNTLIGHAVTVSASGSSEVNVRLIG